jgi:hypothetical protein
VSPLSPQVTVVKAGLNQGPTILMGFAALLLVVIAASVAIGAARSDGTHSPGSDAGYRYRSPHRTGC